MAAELVRFYLPDLVELHNYADANATNQKESNWYCLNKKVLSKLGLQLSPDTIRGLARSHPWVIENVLLRIRDKVDDFLVQRGKHNTYQTDYYDQPEVDQDGGYQYESQAHPRGRRSVRDDEIYSPSWSEPMSEPSRRYVSPNRNRARREQVPAVLLIEKQREADAKDDTIDILNQKIKRMEHLLTLKDVKIEDLNIQIHSLKAGKHNTSPSVSPKLSRKHQLPRNYKSEGFLQPEWK